MVKEDLSIDITFNLCYFSQDSPFNTILKGSYKNYELLPDCFQIKTDQTIPLLAGYNLVSLSL
jgi:hypothetical protein